MKSRKAENMSFNEETDTYTCANNQKLEFRYTSKQKNRSGYILEKRVTVKNLESF